MGQTYVPAINWVLMIACVGLVIGFKESSGLAAAYGVAVTTTMVITTVLFFVVAREVFKWSLAAAVTVCGAFFVVDLAFFGANLPKIPHGGWFPLVVGLIVFTLLTTWYTGRRLVGERIQRRQTDLARFISSAVKGDHERVPGTAVYMYSVPGTTPPALLANFRHNKVLHEDVLVVSIVTDDVPRVHPVRRVKTKELGHGIREVALHYGFMESPDVPHALARLGIGEADTTYFLGKETVLATARPGMARLARAPLRAS